MSPGIEKKEGEWLLPGFGVSIWVDEKVLELDASDGGTTSGSSLMPQNCTFLNG